MTAKTYIIYKVTAKYYFGEVINHFRPSEFHMIKKVLASEGLLNIPVTVEKIQISKNEYSAIFE